MTVFRLMQ